ncbi:MAG: LacI family DNA-binding transcriptional regulator [Luteolibacter sp.]
MSLRDIGKLLGVSHVTVSLALRNNPRISVEVRDKVHQTAAELGYQPDPMLAALAQYRKGRSTSPITAAIAWINAWQTHENLRIHREFDFYWIGAEKAARKFGYRLEEFRVGRELSPSRLHQILTARGITGILLPPQFPHPDFSGFPWENYSAVRFGRSLKQPHCHLVTADQVANTILAYDEIQALGYRRIGFVTNETSLAYGHLFEAGYLLVQRSSAARDRLTVFDDRESGFGSEEKRRQAFLAWHEKNRPDAIITDVATLPALVRSVGLRIPEDLAIAGTTIIDTSMDSGIDQHPEEIGRVGFLMLNSLINDGSRGIPAIFRQNLVEGSWIQGSSMPRKA